MAGRYILVSNPFGQFWFMRDNAFVWTHNLFGLKRTGLAVIVTSDGRMFTQDHRRKSDVPGE